MKKISQTKDCGHKYMAPSCEVFQLDAEHNVMIGTSDVTDEKLEW